MIENPTVGQRQTSAMEGRGNRFAAAVVRLGALLAVLTLAAVSASAHKFHASLAEVNVNSNEKVVEIAIRLFPDDLEAALQRRADRRVRLDATPNVDRLILDYLRDAFVITGADGAPLELEWVGKEATVNTVWVFVQADAPAGLAGARLKNEIFFELFKDQVNTVNVVENGKSTSLALTPGAAVKPIEF